MSSTKSNLIDKVLVASIFCIPLFFLFLHFCVYLATDYQDKRTKDKAEIEQLSKELKVEVTKTHLKCWRNGGRNCFKDAKSTLTEKEIISQKEQALKRLGFMDENGVINAKKLELERARFTARQKASLDKLLDSIGKEAGYDEFDKYVVRNIDKSLRPLKSEFEKENYKSEALWRKEHGLDREK